MSDSVLVDRSDYGVVTVMMNRPESRNALDGRQWELLTDVIGDLSRDESVSCLVLTGSGSSFASGGDVTQLLGEVGAPGGPERFRQRIHECTQALEHFSAPTVARINGPAIGGGLELALCCDVRVAVETAVFAVPAVRFGFVMAIQDFRRLAAAVGPGWARYITMTGTRIDAHHANRIGLVHHVTAPGAIDETVHEVVRSLVEGDWEAARWFRAAARHVSEQADTVSLEAFVIESLKRPEFASRVRSFLDAGGRR